MRSMGRGDFKVELQAVIAEALQESQEHEAEEQRRLAEEQQHLGRLRTVVQQRLQEAVQVGPLALEYASTNDTPGNQRFTLTWIGPGGRRALRVDINQQQGTLQWAWQAPWNEEGSTRPVAAARFATFDTKLEELILQLVRPGPWLRKQCPNP